MHRARSYLHDMNAVPIDAGPSTFIHLVISAFFVLNGINKFLQFVDALWGCIACYGEPVRRPYLIARQSIYFRNLEHYI